MKGFSKDPADFEYEPPAGRRSNSRRVALPVFRVAVVVVAVIVVLRATGLL